MLLWFGWLRNFSALGEREKCVVGGATSFAEVVQDLIGTLGPGIGQETIHDGQRPSEMHNGMRDLGGHWKRQSARMKEEPFQWP